MQQTKQERIQELRARRDELKTVVDTNRETIAKFQLSKLFETCIQVSQPAPNPTTTITIAIVAIFKEKETRFDLPLAQVDFGTVLNLACMAFGGNPAEMMLAMLDAGKSRVLLPRDWRFHYTSADNLKIQVELIPRGRWIVNEEEDVSSPPKQLTRKPKELSSSLIKLDTPKLVDSPVTLPEPKQVRYICIELVLHTLLFILLSIGLWTGNEASHNAALLKQTIEAQISAPLWDHGNARFGINITNTPTLWTWMNNGPLTTLLLFNDSRSNQLTSNCLPTSTLSAEECEFSTPSMQPWLISRGNMVVVGSGGVQFRQYRVSINTCGSPSYFACYGAYSPTTMETRRFGNSTVQQDSNNKSNSLCGFTWVNQIQTEQRIPLSSGVLLDQSGYLFSVVDSTKLLPGLRFLQENQWIDAATRAITIQFVLENPYTGGMFATRLLIEVNEIGNVYTTAKYYTNVSMSSTRLGTNIVALLIELLILGIALLTLIRNNSNNKLESIWRLWDVCFAIMFVASFALDASLMQPVTGSAFAQVQAMDTQMDTANQFRAVLVIMLSIRLCGLVSMFAPPIAVNVKHRALIWKVPLLYLVVIAFILPLYCSLALFWMVLRGTRVNFAVAMRSLFNTIVFAFVGDDVFVLAVLTFCWVFCVPTLLAGTMVFVKQHI